MDTLLEWLGALLILAGFVWWLNSRGYIHLWATKVASELPSGTAQRAASVLAASTLPQEQVSPVRSAVRAAQKVRELPPEEIATDTGISIQERLQNLSVGNTVKITTTTGSTVEDEIVAVVTHHEMLKKNGQWYKTGTTFLLAQLSGGQWIWVRGANFALFDRTLQVLDAQMLVFKKNAQEFGKQFEAYEDGTRPDPPHVELTVEDRTLVIFDIGKSDIAVAGVTNVDPGGARFMCAEDDSGRILWVEDRTDGADVVMFGHRLELSDVEDIQ